MACGDDAPEGRGQVEVGTGALVFESLEGDVELALVAGTQGGFHFIVHARIQGLVPGDPSMPGLLGNPQTTFAAFLEDETQIDSQFPPYRLGYDEGAEGWNALPSGRILQMHPDRYDSDNISELFGQRVRLRVDVRDAAGVRVWDERWILVGAPEPAADAGVPDASL